MKKVMMVVYHYSRDPRPRRECEALLNAGYQIDMICLRNIGENKKEIVRGITVYRLNISKSRDSKIKYIYLYLSFFLRALLKLSLLHLRKKYDVIHVHNMPDFLVFTAILPKLLGSKIILDLHDPSPEIYQTKYGLSKKDRLIKFVIWQEKISIWFSDYVITTNAAFLERFVSRGCPPNKIRIIMNSPQESIFLQQLNHPRQESELKKFIIMYHGFITERNGLDLAVKALDMLKGRIPQFEFRVFGDGEYVQYFLDEVANLKMENHVKYYGHNPIDEIAKRITEIDLGLIPNKSTPFTNINFPVRIFEYLCLKKPVIVPRTKGIKDYFEEDSILFFEPDNVNDLSSKIYKVYSEPTYVREVLNKGYKVYSEYRWGLQSKNLINIYKNLFS